MSFWPGYWRTKEVLDPILTEIPIMKVDKNVKPKRKYTRVNLDGSTQSTYGYGPENTLSFVNARIGYEGLPAGAQNFWCFANDTEIQYMLKGKAEIKYSLEGTQHTEIKTMHVEEGDIYIVPRGARLKWNVDPNMDMLRISITIPGSATPQRAGGAIEELE